MNIGIRINRKWMVIALLVLTMTLWGCGGGGSTPEAPAAQPEEVGAPDASTDAPEAPATEVGQEMDEVELTQLFNQGKALDELYYQMTMTGLEVDGVTRIWLKQGRMRSESEMMGQQFIMIYDEEAVYSLDPQSKTGIKMSGGLGMDEAMDPYTADDFTGGVDDQQLQYLGMESINGIPCHVVQSADIETGYGVKIWLHEDYGFPMRVESLATNPEEAYVMEVTEFQVGGVADSLFDTPEDYEIMDMGAMFQNLPSMPAVPGD